MCNTTRLDRAGGETKEGWVIDRWLGDYKMAYTTPAPPIIHLCASIFVSKENPRQQIGNQSFGQSLPAGEVNVCRLHSCTPTRAAATVFSLLLVPDQLSATLKLANTPTMEIQRLSICYFCLDFSRSFCSRQNHRCSRSKLGTLQRSDSPLQ